MKPWTITRRLSKGVDELSFAKPVTHVYNPLTYAAKSHRLYLEKYGAGPREVLFLGMNPGPWGMAQTGIPFGEITLARDWLGLEAPVKKPRIEHPKRPVQGFACARREVSGGRLWGWARDHFTKPEAFFKKFMVLNYCPLVFMEESGRNRTPDKLPRDERDALFALCDEAFDKLVTFYQPRWVIGVGTFAENRAKMVLGQRPLQIGRILHPSPASPAANRDWAGTAHKQLRELGLL